MATFSGLFGPALVDGRSGDDARYFIGTTFKKFGFWWFEWEVV